MKKLRRFIWYLASRLFLLENYMYYLIKPECRDEARFLFLHNLERNGLIQIG